MTEHTTLPPDSVGVTVPVPVPGAATSGAGAGAAAAAAAGVTTVPPDAARMSAAHDVVEPSHGDAAAAAASSDDREWIAPVVRACVQLCNGSCSSFSPP